ncbi:transglycosylase SLT domain-containing protein [Phaeacidiphilus oryzae]|uniref:transglycosylase SLT domain-containing protein n=1 Tax=Phaeacidiphilus oryzae TaxID=348818 RepID=UPI00055DB690|nr:transglycosylase SLT domain-containing protein [Phaeacidiphilus oryzae]
MAEGRRGRWPWVVLAAVVIAGGLAVERGGGGGADASSSASASAKASASASASAKASASAPGSAAPSASDGSDPYAPENFVAQTVKYGHQAGVDPQLVLAILFNESYKPHDPAFQRAWQRMKPDAAFGVANMHRATFDGVAAGHHQLAGRSWEELPDDPSLAIQAEAWYLHDLAAALPSAHDRSYTKDELLALGYNAGEGNMLAFARGVSPGAQSQTYLATFRQNWPKAGALLKH